MVIEIGSLSLGALLGLFTGALLNHILAKDRATQERSVTRFNAAATLFSEAFSPELTALRTSRPTERSDSYDLLKNAFPKHELAVYRLRELLPEKEKSLLDAAWRDYYFPKGINLVAHEEEVPTYILAQYIGTSREEEQEKKLLAAQRIEVLLSFARPK
ncbi:MAG: hypothetical protein ACXV7J_14165 [Methylomonas sp.]